MLLPFFVKAFIALEFISSLPGIMALEFLTTVGCNVPLFVKTKKLHYMLIVHLVLKW